MSAIKFSPQQLELLTQKLQHYCQDQLELELGQFDAQFLLDFISEHLGGHYYNQGVLDAQAVASQQLDLISENMDMLLKDPD